MTPVTSDTIEEANELIERCMRSLNEIKRGIHRYKFCSENKCPTVSSKNLSTTPRRTPCKYSTPQKQSTSSIGTLIDTAQNGREPPTPSSPNATKPVYNEMERPKTKRGGSRSPSNSSNTNTNTGDDVIGTNKKKQVLVCNIDTGQQSNGLPNRPDRSSFIGITDNEDEKILKLLHMLQTISDTDTVSCSSECSTVCGALGQKQKENIYKEFEIEKINRINPQENTLPDQISTIEDKIRPLEENAAILPIASAATPDDDTDKCCKKLNVCKQEETFCSKNSQQTSPPPSQVDSCSIECCDILANVSVFKVPERSPASMSNNSVCSSKEQDSSHYNTTLTPSAISQSYHRDKSFLSDECKPHCKKISGHCPRLAHQSLNITIIRKSVEVVAENGRKESIDQLEKMEGSSSSKSKISNRNFESDRGTPEAITPLIDQADTSNHNDEKNTISCLKTGRCQKVPPPAPAPSPVDQRRPGTCIGRVICQKTQVPIPIESCQKAPSNGNQKETGREQPDTSTSTSPTISEETASKASSIQSRIASQSGKDSINSERSQSLTKSEKTPTQSEREHSISCGPIIKNPYAGAKYELTDNGSKITSEPEQSKSSVASSVGSNWEVKQPEKDNRQSITCRCPRPQCPRVRITLRSKKEDTTSTSASTETVSKNSERSRKNEEISDTNNNVKEREQIDPTSETGSKSSNESKIVQPLTSETSQSDQDKPEEDPGIELSEAIATSSRNDAPAPASLQSDLVLSLKSKTTQTEEEKIDHREQRTEACSSKKGPCPCMRSTCTDRQIGNNDKPTPQESVAVQSCDYKSQETQSLQVEFESVASQSEEVHEESEAQTEEPSDLDNASIRSDDFCRYAIASFEEGYFQVTSRSRLVSLDENVMEGDDLKLEPLKEVEDILIPVVMEMESEASSRIIDYPFEQEGECICLPYCETPLSQKIIEIDENDASCTGDKIANQNQQKRNLVIQQLPAVNINSRFSYQKILRYWTEINGILKVEATRKSNIGYEEVRAAEGVNEKSATDKNLDHTKNYHVHLNENEHTAILEECNHSDSRIFENEVLESYQVLEATSDIRANEDISIRLPESALDNIEVYQTYLDPSVIIEPMLDSSSSQSRNSEESGSDKNSRMQSRNKSGKTAPKPKFSLLIIPHLQYNFKHVPKESRELVHKKNKDPYKIGFYQDEAVQFPEKIQPEPMKPSTGPSNNKPPVLAAAPLYYYSSSSTSVSSDDSHGSDGSNKASSKQHNSSEEVTSLVKVGETDKMVQISLTSPEESSSDETVDKPKKTDEGKTIDDFLAGLTEQSKKDLDYYQSHGELPKVDVQNKSSAYIRTPISFGDDSDETLGEGAQMLVNLVKSPNRRGTSWMNTKVLGQSVSRTFSGAAGAGASSSTVEVNNQDMKLKRSSYDSNKEGASSGSTSASKSRKIPGSSLVEYCLIEPRLLSEKVKEKSSSLHESGNKSKRPNGKASLIVKKIPRPIKEDVGMNYAGIRSSKCNNGISVSLIEEDTNANMVKRRRRSIPHYGNLLTKHDLAYNLSDSLANDLSEGELYCKCSLSHGEVHTCPLAKKTKLKTKFSKRFEKSVSFLKRQFAEPNQMLMQRAIFTNWVSYYVTND